VTQKKGERWSAARAYLPPEVRSRANLRIAIGTRALRVALEGRRATGVVCRIGAASAHGATSSQSAFISNPKNARR
jgi:choline dehydrogenase-like flavoprotein